MFKYLVVVLVISFISSCTTTPKTPINIPRARAQIAADYSTLLADNGQLLRGAYWSTDWNGLLPDRSYLVVLKQSGLNTLHLYGESFASGLKAGVYKESIDTLVQWTKEEGMYLVLTIGNWDKNGSFDLEFGKNFWSLYAPRYAEETHVIFELQNEPVAWTPNYPQDALEMEKQLYQLVRSLAPESTILLMSYAGFSEPEKALEDIKFLKTFVDFQNAAIAFHGYPEPKITEDTLKVLLEQKIPSINTEFASHDEEWTKFTPDIEVIKLCETYKISWLLFQTESELKNAREFKELMRSATIKWKEDFSD